MAEQVMTDSEVFRHPLTQELLSKIEIPSFNILIKFDFPIQKISDEDRIIAGYCSIEQIDKQNEIIPVEVLKEAWNRCGGKTRSHLMHTNIPVAEIIPEYTEKNGTEHKTGVDGTGLYIVCKVWNHTQKANETWDMIQRKILKGFSIGGEALSKSSICNGICYNQINKLDLHEISIVDNPANPDSTFQILKNDELQKRVEWLDRFPDRLILFKDFINFCGSTAKKGVGRDVDGQIRLPSNLTVECPHCLRLSKVEHPLKRHIHTRFFNDFKEEIENKRLHLFTGDPEGPHDVFYNLYDLALVKCSPVQRVEMTFSEEKRIYKSQLQGEAFTGNDTINAGREEKESRLDSSKGEPKIEIKVKLNARN